MKTAKKECIFNILIHSIPYVILVLAALFSTYVLFYDGIAGGDDIGFHISQIYDIYYGMKHGNFGIGPNHVFMGGFAIYNQSYYGPVSHYSAAIIAFLTSWAGGDVIFGYKATIFLSSILGAIYMYKLGRKISKNYYISLITAFIFIFLPYRSFCALSRCAYGEAVAIGFIPMVFYGAYSILYDDFKVSSYIALALGAAGVIMTHPFTGLLTAIFGVIFVFANFKQIIIKRKDKLFWTSTGITVFLTIGLVLYYVVNSMVVKNSGIYRFSDPEIQWTNLDFVQTSTGTATDFSGFLNIGWIRSVEFSKWWDASSVSFLVFGFFMFAVSIAAMFVVDHWAKKLPWWGRFPIDLVVLIIFPLLMDGRVEQYLALAIFYIMFVVFEIVPTFVNVESSETTEKTIYKDPNFYFFFASFVVCLILIFVADVWVIMPKVMYNVQFAWRIWGMAYFMLAGFVCVLLSDLKFKKPVLNFALAAASSLLLVSQGLVEKRVYLAVAEDADLFVMKDAEEYTLNHRSSGAQNEMVPLCFDLRYDDPDWSTNWYIYNYTPKYENSLYKDIRNRIIFQNNFIYDKDSYIAPAILEGTANIELTKYDCPNFSFNLEVTSDEALIQLPQFYADGYYTYFGNEKVSGENVDGLLSFRLHKGQNSMDVKWVGPTHYRVLRPVFYASLGLVIAGGVVGFIYRKKRLQKY